MKSPKQLIALGTLIACSNAAQAATLWGIDISDNELFTIDTTTGALTILGSNPALNSFNGLDFDASGNLYTQQFGNLYQLDPLTAAATLVGSSGRAFESLEIIGNTGYAADVV